MVLLSITTGTQQVSPYIRGRLGLAGYDLRDDVGSFCDAAYSIIAEAPHDVLEKLDKWIILEGAKAYPERETWGLDPRQRRLSAALIGTGQGAAAPSKVTDEVRVKRGDGRMA